MPEFEIIKIEATHDDPEMNDQIDSLMEGDLNSFSVDYFQDLSRLGFRFFIYLKKNGSDRVHEVIIEDGFVDGVDESSDKYWH